MSKITLSKWINTAKWLALSDLAHILSLNWLAVSYICQYFHVRHLKYTIQTFLTASTGNKVCCILLIHFLLWKCTYEIQEHARAGRKKGKLWYLSQSSPFTPTSVSTLYLPRTDGREVTCERVFLEYGAQNKGTEKRAVQRCAEVR